MFCVAVAIGISNFRFRKTSDLVFVIKLFVPRELKLRSPGIAFFLGLFYRFYAADEVHQLGGDASLAGAVVLHAEDFE